MKPFYCIILFFSIYHIHAQTTDLILNASNPQGMLIYQNELYVARFGIGKVSKVDLNNANSVFVDVLTGLNDPRQMALDGNDLYISETGGGRILKLDISSPTATPVTIASNLNAPQGLS